MDSQEATDMSAFGFVTGLCIIESRLCLLDAVQV